MNEELASKLLLLLGAMVGGLISALSTWGLEHRRWRRERREKLETLRRDALTAALEWIEPMRIAESRASTLVMAAIQGDVDDEQFLKEFPYLIGDLAKKDLSANFRAVLPKNVYNRGHEIIRKIDEIRYLGVKYGQKGRLKGQPMIGFEECNAKLNHIGKLIATLETDLQKAFFETFE